VKKGMKLLSMGASAALLFAVISWGGVAHAQQTSPSTDQTPSQAPPPATQSQTPGSDTQQTPQQTPNTPPDQQAPSTRQGQSEPGQTPDQTTPGSGQTPGQATPPSGQGSGQAQSDTGSGREFVGTIVKQGDKYMFQDSASGQSYNIDHQDEVKKFDGKRVRVRGTLDSQTNTIHVQ